MLQVLIFTVLAIILSSLAIKLYIRGGICKSKNRIDGKTVIITGATSGIGLATAIELAKRGARIILAGINDTNTQVLISDIYRKTGNKNIEFHEVDMSSFASIRQFADKMNNSLDKLDIFINNAGVIGLPFIKTADGYEKQLAINYLGPFLLTNLLIELLKKGERSRIINVSSMMHTSGEINWDDMNLEKNYNAVKSYNQSKLAMILFTKELSKKLKDSGIVAISLHPGIVRTRIVVNNPNSNSRFRLLLVIMVGIVYPLYCLFTKSTHEGAQTVIHCALDDTVLEYSGCYFSDCKPEPVSKAASDTLAAKRLWKMSEQLVGIEKEI